MCESLSRPGGEPQGGCLSVDNLAGTVGRAWTGERAGWRLDASGAIGRSKVSGRGHSSGARPEHRPVEGANAYVRSTHVCARLQDVGAPVKTEIIGNATLYLGDCREVLPAIAPQVVVTDPVWPNCPPDLIAGSDDPWGLWAETLALLPGDVARLVVVMRHDCDPRFLATVPARLPFFRAMWLPYALPSYIGRTLGGDEIAWWFGSPPKYAKGRRLVPGRGPIAQPTPRNGHPCSRSQAHSDWLVGWCSDAGETICDPFMGSCTTGISAIKLGRRFIGCEVDPVHFDLACRRLEEAMLQPTLFGEAP